MAPARHNWKTLSAVILLCLPLLPRLGLAEEKKSPGLFSGLANKVLSAVKPQTAAEAPPEIFISPEDLQSSAGDLLGRMPEMRLIRQKAQELGLSLALREHSAGSFAHYALALARHQRGDSSYVKSRLDGHFLNVFGWDPDLSLQLLADGPNDKVAQLRDWLQQQFSYFKADVKGLSELEMPPEVNSHQIGLVDLTGNATKAPIKDLNQSRAFVEDVASQSLREVKKPAAVKLAPARPAIFEAVAGLDSASAFTLTPDPAFRKKLQTIVANFNPERDLADFETSLEFQRQGRNIFYRSGDYDHLHALLEATDPQRRLAVYPAKAQMSDKAFLARLYEGGTLNMGNLRNKQLLLSQPLGAGISPSAGTLGLTEVSHGTNSYQQWATMTRSLKGKPLAFVSGGGGGTQREANGMFAEGEWAKNGDGFYVWNHPDAVYGEGRDGLASSLNMRVNPKARSVKDFNLTGFNTRSIWTDKPDEKKFYNAAALKVVDDTNGGDPRELFRKYTNPTEKLSKHDFVHAPPQIRRAIADLTVNPAKRAEVDSHILQWITKDAGLSFNQSDIEKAVIEAYVQLPRNAGSKPIADHLAESAVSALKNYQRGEYKGLQPKFWIDLPISDDYPEYYKLLLSEPRAYSRDKISENYATLLKRPKFIEVLAQHPQRDAFLDFIKGRGYKMEYFPELAKLNAQLEGRAPAGCQQKYQELARGI